MTILAPRPTLKFSARTLTRSLSAFCLAVALSGCVGQSLSRGYVVSDLALEQVPVGASREQVLIALGTPSTTADLGGEVFYYISQKTARPVRFVKARVVDQSVLAVYFDENEEVTQIANYGLQDGQVFDFVSRTTPTSGKDLSFVSQVLGAAGNFGKFGGS